MTQTAAYFTLTLVTMASAFAIFYSCYLDRKESKEMKIRREENKNNWMKSARELPRFQVVVTTTDNETIVIPPFNPLYRELAGDGVWAETSEERALRFITNSFKSQRVFLEEKNKSIPMQRVKEIVAVATGT